MDDRFYTPRAQVSTSRSNSTTSDNEYYTPRFLPPQQRQNERLSSSYAENDVDVESQEGANEGMRKVANAFSLARHGHAEALDELLLDGFDVNSRDNQGNTILCIAAQNGNKRILKIALRHGADINSINFKGNSALHFSYRYGTAKSIGEYLLKKGANPDIVNRDGLKARDYGGEV